MLRNKTRHERVLDGAAKILVQHGYHGLHIDQLAKSVRMAKPQIYRLFDTKDEIYSAVLERELRRIERAFETAFARSDAGTPRGDLEQAALRALRVLFDHHQRYPEGLSVLFGPIDWRHAHDFHRRALRRLCHRLGQALQVWSDRPLAPQSVHYMAEMLATVAVANLGLTRAGVISALQAWDVSAAMAGTASDACAAPSAAKCPA